MEVTQFSEVGERASARLQEVVNRLIERGGGVVVFGPGKYVFDEKVIIPQSVTLEFKGRVVFENFQGVLGGGINAIKGTLVVS